MLTKKQACVPMTDPPVGRFYQCGKIFV
jgi:hypothetical protein